MTTQNIWERIQKLLRFKSVGMEATQGGTRPLMPKHKKKQMFGKGFNKRELSGNENIQKQQENPIN